MSLIAIGARGYLDRRHAYNPFQYQMANLREEELRALLQMAQNEGQTEVEQWIAEAMRGRGIYANRRVAKQYTSGMNASDWLEKALALVLAGGILVGGWAGTSLPTVDPSFSGSSPPAIVQVQQQQYTAEQQKMIDDVHAMYAREGLTLPDVTVRWDCDVGSFRGGGQYYHNSKEICMVRGDLGTLVHEYAHAWDYHNLTDSKREQYRLAVNERMEELTGKPDRFTTWLDTSHYYVDRVGEQFARQMNQHLIPSDRDQYYMPDILNIVLR